MKRSTALALRSGYMVMQGGKRYRPNLWKYQAAKSILSHLYRNRKAYTSGAARAKAIWASSRKKYIQRSYKSAPGRAFQKGSFNSNSTTVSIGDKQLYVGDPAMPTYADDNTRTKTNCFIKGFNVCLHLWNTSNIPYEVHFAIIQTTQPTTVITDAQIKTDFFRSMVGTPGASNTLDFQDFATNSSYDIRYLCNPLNPDNKRIITHYKWKLDAKSSNSIKDSGYFRKLNKYFPIKRRVRFETGSDAENARPWRAVFWCLPLNPDDYNSTTQQLNIKHQFRMATVWGEAKN